MTEPKSTTLSVGDGAELLALIERLEKLKRPDRELDLDILFAIFPKDRAAVFEGVKHISTMTNAAGEPWFNPLADRSDCPYYTGSIDAALTLVPEGSWYSLGNHPRPYATVLSIEEFDDPFTHPHRGLGATPAIAICIAALKALAASPSPGSPAQSKTSNEGEHDD
jgi:hypothetical protein